MSAVCWVLGLLILCLCGVVWWWAVTGLDPHDKGGL